MENVIAKMDERFERFFEWLNEEGDEMKKNLVVAGMFGTLLVLGSLVQGAM